MFQPPPCERGFTTDSARRGGNSKNGGSRKPACASAGPRYPGNKTMKDESLDPKRQTMIAALYGELSAEELATFHALLDEDATLRAEWEELREARALLETATINEPVHAPEFVFIDRSRSETKPKRRFSWLPAFSPAWGFASVAACLAILMGTGLRMDRMDNGIVLHFGNASVPTITKPDTQTGTSPGGQQLRPDVPEDGGVRIKTTGQQAVTRDDLNAYSTRILDALTRVVDDSQDRQRKEFADMMGQFYDVMSKE